MKSLRKAVSVAAIFFMLISCSKDDPAPFIVGKWTVQTSVLDLQVGGQSLKDFLTSVGIATSQAQAIVDSYSDGFNAGSPGAILEFKSDGTYSQQNSVNDTNPSTGTWTQDKTSITINDSTKPSYTGTIVSASDTDLSLDLKVKSIDGGGFTVDYIVKTTLKKS